MREQGLYRQQFEHDNCGIGAVVNSKGIKSHKTVENALKIVESLEHRAGKDAEGKTGDGVGILLQISHKFFSKACKKEGIKIGGEREYGIAVLFLPQDELKLRIGTQWYATDPTSSLPLFSNAKTYPVDFETEFYRYENKEREQRRKEYEADPDSLANVLALTLSMRGEGTISESAWEKIQAPMGQIEEQWGRQEISRQEYEKGIISLLKSVWGTEK